VGRICRWERSGRIVDLRFFKVAGQLISKYCAYNMNVYFFLSFIFFEKIELATKKAV